MVQTQYRSTAEVVKESFRKVEPTQFTKVKNGSSDLQNIQTNSFQKASEKSTRKMIEAWKIYLTQKIAAPNLFAITNQLHILCLWYHFEQ